MMARRSAPLLLALGLAACVRPDPAPRYVPAWEPFDPTAPGWQSTAKALVIADCQLHNLLSQPLPDRNLSVESASATAIRPPQLDLFAPDVLGYVLRRHAGDVELVVHLGDALDLACEGELDAFLRVMATSPRPWVMAPGNHDFYYFGSYYPDDPGLWQAACHGAGAPLDKNTFVARYVAALLGQPAFLPLAAGLGIDAPAGRDAAELAARLPDEFEWRAPSGTRSLLERICWRLDREAPWRSFVLQLIDLGALRADAHPAHLLLLDSCQYGHRPVLIPNAWSCYPVALNCGFTGEMLPDQLRRARAWVEDIDAGGVAAMCHHPFASLAPRTRASLGWLWRERNIGLLVTAHTHQGWFAHHDLGGTVEELELNIGSTTDWPMEWRTLQAFTSEAEQRLYFRSERHTLVDALRTGGGSFARGWEVPAGAPDDYRRYRQGEAAGGLLFDFYLAHHLTPYWLPQPTVRANRAAQATEQSVKETLLRTYLRLLEMFPSDPLARADWPAGCADDAAVRGRIAALLDDGTPITARIDLLAELERFERTRRTRDPATGAATDDRRAHFKLSQAAWAARFESMQGRVLRAEDELIRVDWDQTRDKQVRVRAGTAR